MLDPGVAAAVVTASGGVLQELLKLAGKSASPSEQAKKVVARTYEQVASVVTSNSLRVLLVLERLGSNQLPKQVRGQVVEIAKRQEPHGAQYEDDLTYRLKFLSLLGLVQPVGGTEFAITRLGVAFVDKAKNDGSRYKQAFAV